MSEAVMSGRGAKPKVEILDPAGPGARALAVAGLDSEVDFQPSFGVEHLVKSFLAGRSARTMAAYRGDLADFAAFLEVATAEAATGELLGHGHGRANERALAYRAHLVERGLSAATINRRLAALRSLTKLGRTLGIVGWKLECPSLKSEPYRDTRGPGRGGFERLLSEANKRTDAKGRRDLAILRMLFDLGLRRSEVAGLDVEHLDLEASPATLAVLGKGRTGRVKVTLPEPTCEVLAAWLAVREAGAGALFVNYDRAGKGERLSAMSINRVIKDLGSRAGVKVTAHALRHAGITLALDLTGGDVRKVRGFSRHANVQTVMLYDDNRLDMGGEVAALVAGAVPNPDPDGSL